MRAGQLRHRIAIDEPVASQNETGEEIIDWAEVATVWGSIEPLRGREAEMAAQVNAELTTKITIRWSPSVDLITAKWRLRHQNTVYNIGAPPTHVELRQRQIELKCLSGVNLG